MLLPLAGSPGLAVVGTLGQAPGQPATTRTSTPSRCREARLPPTPRPGTTDAADRWMLPRPANRALAIELQPCRGAGHRAGDARRLRRACWPAPREARARHGLPNVAVRPGERYLIAVRREPAAQRPGPRRAHHPSHLPTCWRCARLRWGPATSGSPTTALETRDAAGSGPRRARDGRILRHSTDRDFYRVPIGEASESTLVSVFLTPPSSITASLTVFDRAGAKLQSVRGQPGERVVLRNLAPAALSPPGADRRRRVFYMSAQTEGRRRPRAPLRARRSLGAVPDWEREPNDQPVRATPVGRRMPERIPGPRRRGFLPLRGARGRRAGPGAHALPARGRRPGVAAARRPAPAAGRCCPPRSDRAAALPGHRPGAALIRVQGRRATDYDNGGSVHPDRGAARRRDGYHPAAGHLDALMAR